MQLCFEELLKGNQFYQSAAVPAFCFMLLNFFIMAGTLF